jgi:hypothetical protein
MTIHERKLAKNNATPVRTMGRTRLPSMVNLRE